VRLPDKIDGKRAAIEARLADLHQRESALRADWVLTIDQEGRWLPTFARASQNVVVTAALLDTLPSPQPTGWVRCISD
jgi:hypothetical protein